VTDILTGGEMRHPRVVRCTVGVVSNWNFDRPEANRCAVVAVPFRFRPSSDREGAGG
jgi:hypothetical protein